MNPNARGTAYREPTQQFDKQEKLQKTQTYKKKNQKHPAFK